MRCKAPDLVLESCPFCHRPFAAEQLSKEEIDSSELTKQTDVFFQSPMGGLGGGLAPRAGAPMDPIEIQRIADHPEAFLSYRVTYRCKHCGKDWSRLQVQEVEIPKEYIESEQEEGEGE